MAKLILYTSLSLMCISNRNQKCLQQKTIFHNGFSNYFLLCSKRVAIIHDHRSDSRARNSWNPLPSTLDKKMAYSILRNETRRNINHFIGGHNFFQTKRTYLLNIGEKTPFRKIVIVLKLLLCEKGKNLSFFVNYYFQTHCQCCLG